MKKLSLVSALFLLITIVLAGCGGTTVTPASSGSAEPVVLTVNIGPNPDTIDPALNSAVDGATLIIHAFEGLYTLDKDSVPIPGQAESVAISEDKLTYTFTLRDGLKWSDGSPLTAGDFVYAWNRAISPDTAADYSYMFDVIDGFDTGTLNVTAPDDKTIVVKLKAVTPYFLELTAFPTFSPIQKATIDTNGDQWALAPATYIGNGPYKMTEWVPSSHMTYEKNENYWNYAALGPDKIVFQLMEDDNAILAAYQTGDILFADTVPNDAIDTLKSQDDFYMKGQLGTYYVSFNTSKPPFDNKLVREAFILAVDRDYICTQIGKAGQQPAGAFVPTGMTDSDPTKQFRDVGGNYYDPSATANDANLAQAKELMTQAGYPDGEGFPTIEYLYNTSTGHQQIGEALQAMWAKLGVTVTLQSQEWSTFLNTRKNGDYTVARNGWLADYNDPITFLDMWTTGSGNNDAQWSNAAYDQLISDIKSSDDATVRFEKMHEAEDLIFDDWMLCPIYYYVDLYLMSNKLEGVWSSPLGYKYFMYATITD